MCLQAGNQFEKDLNNHSNHLPWLPKFTFGHKSVVFIFHLSDNSLIRVLKYKVRNLLLMIRIIQLGRVFFKESEPFVQGLFVGLWETSRTGLQRDPRWWSYHWTNSPAKDLGSTGKVFLRWFDWYIDIMTMIMINNNWLWSIIIWYYYDYDQ